MTGKAKLMKVDFKANLNHLLLISEISNQEVDIMMLNRLSCIKEST